MDEHICIAIFDGNGKVIESQPYDEYKYGKKNLKILNFLYGEKLYNILIDDLNIIRYDNENNKLVLKTILEVNPQRTTMKLLGKIAEAVLVRRCNEDPEINRKWLSIARRKEARKKTAKKYRAVGTGLYFTKNNYSSVYNPSDTQRDIVWINTNDEDTKRYALMKNTNSQDCGTIAGLQLKVSRDGVKYIFDDLCKLKYEVPVVYFDLNKDYENIARKLWNHICYDNSARYLNIPEDFIQASAVDRGGYDEVCELEELVDAVITGKLKIEDLIDRDQVVNNPTFRNAILSTAFSEIGYTNNISSC